MPFRAQLEDMLIDPKIRDRWLEERARRRAARRDPARATPEGQTVLAHPKTTPPTR
jgi:hypothetical protein